MLTKKQKQAKIAKYNTYRNNRLKHTKFRIRDIVKFINYENEYDIGVITEIHFFLGTRYTITSLDFKKCYTINSTSIKKIGRYPKLNRSKHIFKKHMMLKLDISNNFINEYCNFYGDNFDVFSKELNDRNIHGIVNAEILDYYTYSKSYDVNIGDEIVLHERLILKALL